MTREAEKAVATAAAVEAAGGVPVVFPTIETAPPADPAAVDDAIRRIASFDVVVVSSRTGARAFCEALSRARVSPGATRVAAVGRGTAAALYELGVRAAIVPQREDAEGLLAALLSLPDPGGRRALVLRAEAGREVVQDGLAAAGWSVEAVVAYRTVTAAHTRAEVASLLSGPRPDAALFMSPSAFEGLLATLGPDAGRAWLDGMVTVAIGRATAAAMARAGIPPRVVASSPSVEAALCDLSAALPLRVVGDAPSSDRGPGPT